MTDKTSVADWSTTPSENDNVGGVELAENKMRPKDVNNAIRTVMAQVKDAVGGVISAPFATKALAEAYTPKAAPDFIQTAGYSAAGDGGGALYKKVGTEPSHAGKFSITLADGTTVVWYEIAEKEIDPLMMPAVIGTDDTANFAHALEYAEKITLTPGRGYVIHNRLDVSRPVLIDFNGAIVSCASGFTDGQLFQILSDEVEMFGGGLIDGTNLPPITEDYDGTDYTGHTIFCPGTSSADNKTRIKLRDLYIKSGQAGALYLQYCPDADVSNIHADGSATIAELASNSLIAFNFCDRMTAAKLKAEKAKWKAIEFRNSADWVATNLWGETSAADQCALFFVGSSKFSASGLGAYGGFGIKADSCDDAVLAALKVSCAGVGEGGIYIQGCSKVAARGGIIRDFTSYGAAVGPHTTKGKDSIDCEVSGLQIYKADAVDDDLTAGVYLIGDATYGLYGTTIFDSLIRGVDIGIRSFEASTVKTDNVDVCGNRFKDIKSYALYGPTTSLEFSRNKIEASTGLTDVVFTWSKNTGSTLVVDNNEAFSIGTAARLLNLVGNATRPVSFDQVSICGNKQRGGIRLADINMQSTSTRVRVLNVQNNQTFGGASATALSLSSASGTNMQVNITGNAFYDADGVTKQAIVFAQDAASGKFNGIVDNNMASVTNAPNNA